ncbi:ABC transporter substrate-binding protein [Streptomyces hoynatensis]|uniref:ABC transporter substrate-binding protein n=1 Tax=Streptomyces hoynatensis TaxID=1141874 RepID=A0A3A9ZBZ6_9ACTN|nr:ABC transporter substrate-binding protein [Streptomyces hoynatensis]RKN45763.1 ABC transporter substrate-binding protein [Streptomyces hoynatensis]
MARSPRTSTRPAALAAALVVSGLLATAGCSAGGSTAAAEGTPGPGGELTFALASDPVCVDPQQRANNDAIYPARQLVDSLTDEDPETGEIVPWLATSWDINEDATEFTFHLREDATFSDGTPVDAQAVRDNFDAIVRLGAQAPLGSGYLAGYVGTTVADAHTARVAFEQPNAQFLQATSTFSLGLLARSTTSLPAAERCTDHLVGSGAFVLEEYRPNQVVVETRREDYAWGSSLWRHRGPAYLEKLTFRVIPESGVRTGALQSGQVDAIGGVAPQDEQGLADAGFRVQSRSNPGLPFGLSANLARPALRDERVRRAVQAAVDRQEVVDTVLSPSFVPATSALAHTTHTYADLSGALAHDPEEAKRLLTEAGWEPGPDGVRVKDGERLSLTVLWTENFGPNENVLQLLQQQLKEAGVELRLRTAPLADFLAEREAGDYDFTWGNTTRTDPDIMRTQYSAALTNYGHLPADSTLEELLQGQNAATDAGERAGLSARAQRELLERAVAVPVFELTTVLGLADRVHDLDFEASSRIQLHDTWVS